MKEEVFFKYLKKVMDVNVIWYIVLLGKFVNMVVVCGGVGGFLLGVVKGQGVDIFIIVDYKYYEFFDVDG